MANSKSIVTKFASVLLYFSNLLIANSTDASVFRTNAESEERKSCGK